jgi:hypothetical protein
MKKERNNIPQNLQANEVGSNVSKEVRPEDSVPQVSSEKNSVKLQPAEPEFKLSDFIFKYGNKDQYTLKVKYVKEKLKDFLSEEVNLIHQWRLGKIGCDTFWLKRQELKKKHFGDDLI